MVIRTEWTGPLRWGRGHPRCRARPLRCVQGPVSTRKYTWSRVARWFIFIPKLIEILVLERTCLSCSCKHFGQKTPCKKSADLHPRQGNLLQWNIFTGLNKIYLHLKNRVETSWKNRPFFFNMRVLDLDFYAQTPYLGNVVNARVARFFSAQLTKMGDIYISNDVFN
jgi:hypothetical protein